MQGYQTQSIREKLLAERSLILNKLNLFASTSQVPSPASGDEADHAASEITLNLSLSLKERDRLLLQKIDRALAKIDSGTYGECEACGAELNKKRLFARPIATLCIDCKEEQESLERFYA